MPTLHPTSAPVHPRTSAPLRTIRLQADALRGLGDPLSRLMADRLGMLAAEWSVLGDPADVATFLARRDALLGLGDDEPELPDYQPAATYLDRMWARDAWYATHVAH